MDGFRVYQALRVDLVRFPTETHSHFVMTPSRDNLELLVTVSLALAVFLSLLLFVVEKIRRRKIRWGGFVVFVVAGYGVLMVGYTTKLANDIHARRNEETTVGLVIGNDRANHNQYQFEYAVHGQRYTAWHQGTVDCGPSDIAVGGASTVYYDPAHPNRADLCSFRAAVKTDTEILGLVLGMLVFTAVITRKSW